MIVDKCNGWNTFQGRGLGLTKQLQDSYDQLEVSGIEKITFGALRDHEDLAVPKRLEVSSSVYNNPLVYNPHFWLQKQNALVYNPRGYTRGQDTF